MRQTKNYALNLPEGPDNYNKDDYNVNFKIIDDKMKFLAKYIIPGENIDSVNVVAELPVDLVENAMYLIPIINQLVPSIPNDTGYEKFIIVANVENALVNYSLATEFYLFAGSKLATRGSYPEDLTMGNANSQTAFSKIYRYIVGGDFEWSEHTSIDWINNVPIHKLTNVIYASENIVRNTVGTVMFTPDQSIIKSDGTYSDAGFPNQYQTYYVLDGEAKKRGITDLAWITDNLLDIVKPITITENGTYTADNMDAFGYSPITVNVEELAEVTERDFDFTQSINDQKSGMAADITNCTFTEGRGLDWDNYSSKVEAFYTLNQKYNYDIIFKFDANSFGFSLTGRVCAIINGVYLHLNSGGMLAYNSTSTSSGGTDTGINIDDLADKKIILQVRQKSETEDWEVFLDIADLNYNQKIGELSKTKQNYFRFGNTGDDSFMNWILKYLKIKKYKVD